MEIDIEKIKNSIQLILNKSHTNSEKRKMRVKDYGTRPLIEMACPICGDSSKNPSKKRGNLFLNNMFYVCFNCDEKLSYLDLLKKFNINIDINDKLSIYDQIDKFGKKKHFIDYDLSSMDKLMDLDDVIKKYNDKKDIIFDFKPIVNGSMVYNYLKYERSIHNFDNIYEGILKITNKWYEPVMIILNRHNNKLLGFQLRNLKKEKYKRIYKIYDFQKIYNYINNNNPITNEESLPYNKLSHFYNILNVNFYDKLTIFEGYLDSVFFPNSIGSTGVESETTFLENENIEIRYFYDNDFIGLKKSIEKINKGMDVFLWKKLFKDLSKGVLKKEYFMKNNIKDLNELIKYTKKDYKTLNLEDYFSKDIFDKVYL
jgi:hypothetical protein